MLSPIEYKLSELFESNPQPYKSLMRRMDLRGLSLSHVWKMLGFIIYLLIENEKTVLELSERINQINISSQKTEIPKKKRGRPKKAK